MKTQLILREDIPTLGFVGDVIEVSAGYARNFLIPSGKAFAYTEDSMLRIEKARAQAEQHRIEMNKEFEAIAARLSEVELTFEENISADGHLYGAVTAKRISDALVEKSFDLPLQNVRLAEPIRAVGEFQVPIHIHGDVGAEIKVWVVSIQQDAPAEEEVTETDEA